MSVSTSRTTPGGIATYPAKSMRPLRVARWPTANKISRKTYLFSAKISHLVFTYQAVIAALKTNLYNKPFMRARNIIKCLESMKVNPGKAQMKETSGPMSTGPLCRKMVPTCPW
jgi:hypothetical protein